MEATSKKGGAQAGGKQGPGAGDGQGDPGGGVPRPARRGGEMIKRRLKERSWVEEGETWQKGRGEGRWPATFCRGEEVGCESYANNS